MSSRFGTLIVVLMFGCEPAPEPAPEAAAERSTPLTVPAPDASPTRHLRLLNPEAFRPEIETIERVLYRPDEPEPGDWRALNHNLTAILETIGRDDPPPVARRLGAKVLQFSALASTPGSDGFTSSARAVMRGEWEELRETVFATAGWLRPPRQITPSRAR